MAGNQRSLCYWYAKKDRIFLVYSNRRRRSFPSHKSVIKNNDDNILRQLYAQKIPECFAYLDEVRKLFTVLDNKFNKFVSEEDEDDEDDADDADDLDAIQSWEYVSDLHRIEVKYIDRESKWFSVDEIVRCHDMHFLKKLTEIPLINKDGGDSGDEIQRKVKEAVDDWFQDPANNSDLSEEGSSDDGDDDADDDDYISEDCSEPED